MARRHNAAYRFFSRMNRRVLYLRILLITLLLARLPLAAGLFLTVPSGGDTDWALNLCLVTLILSFIEALALSPFTGEYWLFQPLSAKSIRGQRWRLAARLIVAAASFLTQVGAFFGVIPLLDAPGAYGCAVPIVVLSGANFGLLTGLAIYTRRRSAELRQPKASELQDSAVEANEAWSGSLARTFEVQEQRRRAGRQINVQGAAGVGECNATQELKDLDRNFLGIGRALGKAWKLASSTFAKRQFGLIYNVGLFDCGSSSTQIMGFASIAIAIPLSIASLIQAVVFSHHLSIAGHGDNDQLTTAFFLSFPSISLGAAVVYATVIALRAPLKWSIMGLTVADVVLGLSVAAILIGVFSLIFLSDEDLSPKASNVALASQHTAMLGVQGVLLVPVVGTFLAVSGEHY